jgi:hypothetical protein
MNIAINNDVNNDVNNNVNNDNMNSYDNVNNKFIDTCIFNSSHYDIAYVIYIFLKDKHRYIKNNTWEYLNSLSEWVIDVNNQQLIYSIRTIVCSAFTQRSLYWANMKSDTKYQDTEIISNKLLIISSKLKDNKYISMLIKECKQFFVT